MDFNFSSLLLGSAAFGAWKICNLAIQQESPAQFQERCAQIALQCFWEKEQSTLQP